MNQEDITRMAREAGMQGMLTDVVCTHEELARFAALVAEYERNACAKVCDVLATHPEYASDITKLAATAIRARGDSETNR